MTEWGADPGQLDDLAALFGGLATKLEQQRAWLTGWVEGDRFWRGTKANEFRHEWSSSYAPQIASAATFLNDQVAALHAQANQQRVASGEAPRDYGGGSFLSKLFGGAVHDVGDGASGLLHGIGHLVDDAKHDLGTVWSMEVTGFHEIVGSPVFADVVKTVQVVNTVAAIASLIPGLQVVTVPLMVASSAVILAAHLAQMANSDHFNPVQFGEDSLNLASAGLAGKALAVEHGVAAAAKAAGGSARDISAAVDGVKTSLGADRALILTAKEASTATVHGVVTAIRSNPVRTATILVHSGQTLDTALQTSYKVGNDVASGDYNKALFDGSLGLAGTTAASFGFGNAGEAIGGASELIDEAGGYDGLGS